MLSKYIQSRCSRQIYSHLQCRELEGEIQRLIGWAAAAIERSSNQPMLPFAIIIINAVDNRTDENLYDVGMATQKLLEGLKEAVYRNPAFKQWATFWRENGREIDTTRDLLLSYYTDVRIVFVPDKGRPKMVDKQYRVLHREIEDAVTRSQARRQNAHLLLSSDQFNLYLQFAFEHFSMTLNTPFDFVTASDSIHGQPSHINPILCLVKAYMIANPAASSLAALIEV